ncbi:RDD family protein [Streptomyces sp. NRRL F-4489]|uniref:RDD family protein n=1 Tax=Streptomyces sp. NRRL F-4489 TaxID=1609095 RepID=UPI001F1B2F39|nr:RDD family protein [Streptomyces sp. NRRL F-4489]
MPGVPSQPYPPQTAAPSYGVPQAPQPQMGVAQGPPPQALAVPGMRLLARFIDYLITAALIAGAWVPTTIWMSSTFKPEDSRGVPVVFGLFAWTLLVGLFFEPLTMAMGGTLGKAICGLRVVRLETGEKLGFGHALGRWLAYLGIGMVPVLGLVNVLSCIWNEPFRQCMHDKAAKTAVIKRRWR